MLLNKIPVLDKGYVALLNAANPYVKMKDIKDNYLQHLENTEKLNPIASMTLITKCPIFVQTHLSQFNLNIIHTRPNEIEAYVPNVTEISGPDLDTNRDIADDLYRTTEALMINPKAYQSDGCDKFISHVIMPISTYTTIIVHGDIIAWKSFLMQSKLPSPIESYRIAIEQIYSAEWR